MLKREVEERRRQEAQQAIVAEQERRTNHQLDNLLKELSLHA